MYCFACSLPRQLSTPMGYSHTHSRIHRALPFRRIVTHFMVTMCVNRPSGVRAWWRAHHTHNLHCSTIVLYPTHWERRTASINNCYSVPWSSNSITSRHLTPASLLTILQISFVDMRLLFRRTSSVYNTPFRGMHCFSRIASGTVDAIVFAIQLHEQCFKNPNFF